MLLRNEQAYKLTKGVTGSTVAKTIGNVKWGNLVFENEVYLPQATHNLLSLKRLFKKGYQFEWNTDQ